MSNKLAVIDYDTTQSISTALYKSGYFSDVHSEAQAVVKVLAGRELGLEPFAAMVGLHIIKGKPVLGANVIATLVKNDPRYDYRIRRLEDDGCEIAFFENGEEIGVSTFTRADANKAGLSGDNWTKYARNMMFARAISNGAKWFTPGIFGGAPVYTPDEMGADVDPDGYINGETIEETRPQGSYDSGGTDHYYDPEPDDDDSFDRENLINPDPPQEVKDAKLAETRLDIETSATTGNGSKKLMAPVKFVEYAQKALGFKDPQHVRRTMKLLGWKAVPNDSDERKRIYEALKEYRAYRDAGMSQDESLQAMADREAQDVE